jgi:hypothetical protein
MCRGIEPELESSWLAIEKELRKSGYFSKQYTALVALNFAKQDIQLVDETRLKIFPANLFLQGFNSYQVRDFNAAILKFGVFDRNFSSFFDRIKEHITFNQSSFLSLAAIKRRQFIQFCEFMYGFQHALLSIRSEAYDFHLMKLRVLNGFSAQFYALRNHKISMLREIISSTGTMKLREFLGS